MRAERAPNGRLPHFNLRWRGLSLSVETWGSLAVGSGVFWHTDQGKSLAVLRRWVERRSWLQDSRLQCFLPRAYRRACHGNGVSNQTGILNKQGDEIDPEESRAEQGPSMRYGEQEMYFRELWKSCRKQSGHTGYEFCEAISTQSRSERV